MIILASSSPRRQELLRSLGLSFLVMPPVSQASPQGDKNLTGVDEMPLPSEAPSALVQRLSRLKAEAIPTNPALPTSTGSHSAAAVVDRSIIIVAADTVVVLGNQILGKPSHATEAIAMLQKLRQQSHHVYTGLTVAWLNGEIKTFVTRLHQSTVRMRPYTDAEIVAYVASGDPLDKAGAYGIQNKSFAPVAQLEGCFASVMGLPLGELVVAFKELGLSLPESASRCSLYTGYPCCQNYQGESLNLP
ncbi:MAG: septum formation protein Maf [Chloroflexi bacterium]|nr:septum formation protein Maf [Chloroflexota bacterium]